MDVSEPGIVVTWIGQRGQRAEGVTIAVPGLDPITLRTSAEVLAIFGSFATYREFCRLYPPPKQGRPACHCGQELAGEQVERGLCGDCATGDCPPDRAVPLDRRIAEAQRPKPPERAHPWNAWSTPGYES